MSNQLPAGEGCSGLSQICGSGCLWNGASLPCPRQLQEGHRVQLWGRGDPGGLARVGWPGVAQAAGSQSGPRGAKLWKGQPEATRRRACLVVPRRRLCRGGSVKAPPPLASQPCWVRRQGVEGVVPSPQHSGWRKPRGWRAGLGLKCWYPGPLGGRHGDLRGRLHTKGTACAGREEGVLPPGAWVRGHCPAAELCGCQGLCVLPEAAGAVSCVGHGWVRRWLGCELPTCVAWVAASAMCMCNSCQRCAHGAVWGILAGCLRKAFTTLKGQSEPTRGLPAIRGWGMLLKPVLTPSPLQVPSSRRMRPRTTGCSSWPYLT